MYISIFIYTALLLTGSFIGFYKASSVMSLVMGLVFSSLLILFTLLYRQRKKWAGQLLLLTILILDLFFFWRYSKTGALMPAGLFSVLSSILLVITYLRIRKSK